MLEYVFKPLTEWPGEATPAHKRQRSQFDSKWTATMKLLEREVNQLRAVRDTLVIATFHPPNCITRSGSIRIGSKLPAQPGVIVSFEVNDNGKRSAMQYECDRFTFWEDNVRAIALALEALRKVDRYGIGRPGAQYKGYLALPPAPIRMDGMSDLQAAELLCKHAGHVNSYAMRVLEDRQVMEETYRQAARNVHPDKQDGIETFMAEVNVAASVLRARFGPKGASA
jgi:hypothetical protein